MFPAGRHFLRASMLLLVLGGVLMAGATILGMLVPATTTHASWAYRTARALMHWAAVVLLLGGLPGLHALQAHRAGWMGDAGFLVTLLALALVIGLDFGFAFILPWYPEIGEGDPRGPLGVLFLIGYPLRAIGVGLLAAGTVRARVLPEHAAWLLVAGLVLDVVNVPLDLPVRGSLLVGGAFAWLGVAGWRAAHARDP